MTDTFDSGSISDLMKFRLDCAFETLEEVDYTAKGGYFY